MRLSTAAGWRRCALAGAMVAGLCACDRSEPAASVEAPRIASLSPAMTATVARLGLAEHVVGRTPWCDAVGVDVPIVGSLTEFDTERLARLHPTHVLVQPPQGGVDPGLERLAARRGWRLVTHPIEGVDDIKALVLSLPEALGADDPALRETLTTRAAAIVETIEAATTVDGDAVARASPVLLLFSLDPPMAFGAGSYLDDMLERMGGVNAVSARGYPQLSLEDIHRAAPRSIVLVRAEPSNAAGPADPFAPLRGLGLDALAEGRCAVLRHPSAHTPGPDVVALAQALRVLLERGVGAADTAAPPEVEAR